MAWEEFIFALSLNLSESIQPITVTLNTFTFAGQYGTEWNNMMAVATAIVVPIIITFVSLQRCIVSGIASGATKE